MENNGQNGKKVLVTGASGGIGQAIARAAARSGYEVVAHYNRGKESVDAEEFGVSAAAMAAPAAGAAAPAAEEKTEFDVVLTGFDASSKIKVIKVVREITGQGLAEAKATVEGAPTTIKEGASKDDAEELKKKIEEVGGKVELK